MICYILNIGLFRKIKVPIKIRIPLSILIGHLDIILLLAITIKEFRNLIIVLMPIFIPIFLLTCITLVIIKLIKHKAKK